MRDVFVNTLIDIAKKDEKLVLLMAEVGFGVVEPFQEQFPDRFYNVGISEQNLILVAAGMALQGYHPVAYSMSSFLATRAFEMIKTSICYQNLPVTLVGIGSGVSYGKMGSTHHATEESALMRVLPNMEVIFPADGDGCKAALEYAIQSDTPTYIGLEKERAQVSDASATFSKLWKKVYDGGDDAAVIACGTMVNPALQAAYSLKEKGIGVTVYSAQVVKPLDQETIKDACQRKNLLILDEHSKCCGLGAEIAGYVLESGNHNAISNYSVVSIPDEYPEMIKSENTLRTEYGMDPIAIVNRIEKMISGYK